MKNLLSRVRELLQCSLIFGLLWSGSALCHAQTDSVDPRVEFNADHIGPRAIEDLTSKSVARDYGLAWSTMSQALAQNRADLLETYFTGFAKDDLTNRVSQQNKTGIRTRYRDEGHKLEAVFYAPAGDVMQLRDQAKGNIEVLDGDKVIYSEPITTQYLVLMTPGADRWLVRDLQSIPEARSR